MFVDYADSIGGLWTIEPPQPSGENGTVFQATDYTFSDNRVCPFPCGVARYRIAEQFVGGAVYGGPGLVIDDTFDDDLIEPVSRVVLQSAMTATNSTSWTRLKTLFR